MNFDQLNNFFQRAIAPLKRKVLLMIGRAIMTTIKDGKIQTMQLTIMADEVQEDVQYYQHFGFRSKPVAMSDAIVAAVGGNRDNLVCLATENKEVADTLPSLAEGESVIYAKGGTTVHIKKDGAIDIKSATVIDIESADVNITGNVMIGGNLVVGGNSDIGGNETVGGTSTIAGALTAQAVTALTTVGAVSMTASGAVASQTLTVAGTTFADFKTKYNSHTHTDSEGGSTTPPTPTI